MEPANDRELQIAVIVDKLSIEGSLSVTSIADVIALLNFTLSRTESEFLVTYTRWRMGHPIVR
jgi:hypothetical protein